MNPELQYKYRAHMRGVAMLILLEKHDAPMNDLAFVRLYSVDLMTVTADIAAIVEGERHNPGGVFEITRSGSHIRQTQVMLHQDQIQNRDSRCTQRAAALCCTQSETERRLRNLFAHDPFTIFPDFKLSRTAQ